MDALRLRKFIDNVLIEFFDGHLCDEQFKATTSDADVTTANRSGPRPNQRFLCCCLMPFWQGSVH